MTKNKRCIKCNQEINPLRIKALPTAKTCVDCSTTGAKRGTPIMFGDKDNTWVDVVFMEPDDFDKFEKSKNFSSTFDSLETDETPDPEKEEDNSLEDL
jgi:hypothetical protein